MTDRGTQIPPLSPGDERRLADIFRDEGEPYPELMAVFVATNAPEEARKLLARDV